MNPESRSSAIHGLLAGRSKAFLIMLITAGGIIGSGAALAERPGHSTVRRENSGPQPVISSASWNHRRHRLDVSGSGTPRATVTVVRVYDPSRVPGSDHASRRQGSWSLGVSSPAPCRHARAQARAAPRPGEKIATFPIGCV